VLALRVVEHLDVVEHVLPRGFAGQVGASSDAFPLAGLEEAFRDRVVMAVAAAAHAGLQIVLACRLSWPRNTCLSRLVNCDPGSEWIIILVLGHRGLGEPADHPAREQVDDDGQVRPPLMGFDIR
jgi:hypothetical protein